MVACTSSSFRSRGNIPTALPYICSRTGRIPCTAEIVHCRIAYRREHLYRLGTITRPHRLGGGRLREARDLHLLTLKEECGREDFGELLEGRT